MKKRKILALLCVASLSAGLLAGCGSDKKEESSTTESKENTDNEEASENQEEVSGFTDGDNGANVENRQKPQLRLQRKTQHPMQERTQQKIQHPIQERLPGCFLILQNSLPGSIMRK